MSLFDDELLDFAAFMAIIEQEEEDREDEEFEREFDELLNKNYEDDWL